MSHPPDTQTSFGFPTLPPPISPNIQDFLRKIPGSLLCCELYQEWLEALEDEDEEEEQVQDVKRCGKQSKRKRKEKKRKTKLHIFNLFLGCCPACPRRMPCCCATCWPCCMPSKAMLRRTTWVVCTWVWASLPACCGSLGHPAAPRDTEHTGWGVFGCLGLAR